MKTKPPIFFANPRSKSTALQTLASPYMEASLGLLPLGHQTEFFREYSHRYFFNDSHLDRKNRAEYFPLNRENTPITHHFTYPPIYSTKGQRDGHKLQVLKNEKDQGREYNIKIMSEDIYPNLKKDHRWDRSILDFFSDRTFVITRRRNVKTLAFSLLVSLHTNLWHKRESNKDRYQDLYNNPITINKELCTAIIPSLKSTAMMDQFEEYIKKSGYKSHTVYYEDLITLEDMKDTLDKVFDNNAWREYINDDFIDRSMPRALNLDYKEIIKNYDEVSERINQTLEYAIG
jgi:hypothetical protein